MATERVGMKLFIISKQLRPVFRRVQPHYESMEWEELVLEIEGHAVQSLSGMSAASYMTDVILAGTGTLVKAMCDNSPYNEWRHFKPSQLPSGVSF